MFTIQDFLTKDECKKYINHTIKKLKGIKKTNCYQYVSIDIDTSTFLMKKLKQHQIELLNNEFVDVYDKINFTKYTTGDFKELHRDNKYISGIKKDEITKLTLLIYLNDNFEGGETEFYPDFTDELKTNEQVILKKKIIEYIDKIKQSNIISNKPVEGTAVIFDTDIIHQGMPILSGEKYIINAKLQFKY